MSEIQNDLDRIMNARYGKDVRQSIHDGILDCHEDANMALSEAQRLSQSTEDALEEIAAVIDDAEQATETLTKEVSTAVEQANTAAQTASASAQDAQDAAKEAREAAENIGERAGVGSIKGDAETEYRSGDQINITPADIGTLSSTDIYGLVNEKTDSLEYDVLELQEEIVKKQPNITGAASTITLNNLTASRALISDSNGKIGVSGTTVTELGYMHGVTSAIQTQLNNKLNLAGGTVKGTLNTAKLTVGVNGSLAFYDTDGSYGYFRQYGAQQLVIRASAEDNQGLFFGVRDGVWSLSPDTGTGNGQNLYLGSPSFKYHTIFAANGTINTSDRNMKENIQYLTDDDKYLQLFMKLLPCSFTYKNTNENDSHDRTHIGFIAQDVEQAMEELNLTSLDFAGFCKDQKTVSRIIKETVIDEATGEKTEIEKMTEEKIKGEYIYSLRYQEFIALITKAVQNNCRRMDSLEQRLSRLEETMKGGQT